MTLLDYVFVFAINVGVASAMVAIFRDRHRGADTAPSARFSDPLVLDDAAVEIIDSRIRQLIKEIRISAADPSAPRWADAEWINEVGVALVPVVVTPVESKITLEIQCHAGRGFTTVKVIGARAVQPRGHFQFNSLVVGPNDTELLREDRLDPADMKPDPFSEFRFIDLGTADALSPMVVEIQVESVSAVNPTFVWILVCAPIDFRGDRDVIRQYADGGEWPPEDFRSFVQSVRDAQIAHEEPAQRALTDASSSRQRA